VNASHSLGFAGAGAAAAAAARPGAAALEAQIRAEELLAAQYARMQPNASGPIAHPFPAYPNTTFVYSACGSSNPYLILTVRDQQVPVVVPGEQVNETVQAFAVNSWAEIAYNDPSWQKFDFHIAEDLIYDVNNDTFAVATPFDIRSGQHQTAGVSSIGQGSSSSSGASGAAQNATADSGTTYNIQFTFLSNPVTQLAGRSRQQAVQLNETALAARRASRQQQRAVQRAAQPYQQAAVQPDGQAAQQVQSQAAAAPPPAAAPSPATGTAPNQTGVQPSGGVVRITSGQLDDSQVGGKAFEAFADLVARLYFNIVTAALGNACNPGCALTSRLTSCPCNN
jgi:hypothetical protein